MTPREVLAKIEWVIKDVYGNPSCIECTARQEEGHADNCAVKAALSLPDEVQYRDALQNLVSDCDRAQPDMCGAPRKHIWDQAKAVLSHTLSQAEEEAKKLKEWKKWGQTAFFALRDYRGELRQGPIVPGGSTYRMLERIDALLEDPAQIIREET